jgi:hypothetical protein
VLVARCCGLADQRNKKRLLRPLLRTFRPPPCRSESRVSPSPTRLVRKQGQYPHPPRGKPPTGGPCTQPARPEHVYRPAGRQHEPSVGATCGPLPLRSGSMADMSRVGTAVPLGRTVPCTLSTLLDTIRHMPHTGGTPVGNSPSGRHQRPERTGSVRPAKSGPVRGKGERRRPNPDLTGTASGQGSSNSQRCGQTERRAHETIAADGRTNESRGPDSPARRPADGTRDKPGPRRGMRTLGSRGREAHSSPTASNRDAGGQRRDHGTTVEGSAPAGRTALTLGR